MKNKHDENLKFAWKNWGGRKNIKWRKTWCQKKSQFYWVKKNIKSEKNLKNVVRVANKKVKFQATQGDFEDER